jgi:D-alanyl-D-alanine carboxypeptidase
MSSELRAHSGAFAKAVALLLGGMLLWPAAANAHHHRHYARSYGAVSATDPIKDAALVVDGATGKALYSRNADLQRHPASLTKMMTLYLLFDALKDSRVTMATQLPVSAHAAAQKPTNLHMYAGEQIPVEAAIKAIVVRSANDVAVTIAEALGGTEAHFAEMMTARAKDLGMHSTYYHNASGLPDELQITTANDLAILAHHLAYDYPQYFRYFSTPSFTFHGITYPTHDNLIGRYDGADGIKTGYTGASGFNLVSSVVRGGTHIIGVVMGGRTAHLRDRMMVAMLDNTFAQIATNPMLVARATVPWHAQVAMNTTAPLEINAAGTGPTPFQLAGTPTNPAGAAPAGVGPQVAMIAPQTLPSDSDDEDAAEAKTNEGNLDLAPRLSIAPPKAAPPPVLAPPPPPPATQAGPKVAMIAPFKLSQPAPTSPMPGMQVAQLIKPLRKPHHLDIVQPQQQPLVAALAPPAKPSIRQGDSDEVGEGDISYEQRTAPTPALAARTVARAPAAAPVPPGTRWMIQIGAYASQSLAKAQLATYAEKSMDVLGQAARVVAPFQSVDGHTVFRARFGPFAEREAREVCSRLTQRGQTCFAAVATR